MAPAQPPDKRSGVPPPNNLIRRMTEKIDQGEDVLATRENQFFVSGNNVKRTLDMFTTEYKARNLHTSSKRVKVLVEEDDDPNVRTRETRALMREQRMSLPASDTDSNDMRAENSQYKVFVSDEHDSSSQGGPSSMGGSSQGNVNYANERVGHRGGARGGFSQGTTSYKRGRVGRRNGGRDVFSHGNPNHTRVGRGGRSGFSRGIVGQGYHGGGRQFSQHESVEIERVVDTEDETSRDKIHLYLKVKYPDQEREDMKMATTADSFYRTNSGTTKCANCGHFGHRITDCEEKPSNT
ncbi:hypothetical protein CFIO01_07019 [Colletotrichum fioriniae PJ7]|uniref:CCHC-type domain-containing protein n=1 Tax=Colletotrichum fioriniae PJ7 TaxID=1445577 RepID=A0A010SEC6_9PEZI|nr:hypothetical protein CFIO01_07019 [Colletotrichum fioriniae PJ7]